MPIEIPLLLAGIGLLGFLCQWLAWRLHIPAILPLLLAGLAIGPFTGILNPDSLFGDLLVPIVSLAVAVILFEGSLTLEFHQLKGIGSVVRRLISIGSLISASFAALAAHYLTGFSWPLAILFGALMTVTGPTVIVPMLRTVRPISSIARVLRWEGILIDPLGALFTVLMFDFVLTQHLSVGHLMADFTRIVAVGTLGGILGGVTIGLALRHHWVPEYLHNVFVLNLVFAVFAISNQLADEAGLLAVTLMGIVLANMRDIPVKEILDFKETLSILLISTLFILLAARINHSDFHSLGWGALGVFMVLQFVSRPIKVSVATLGSELNWRERALIAWIGPRGIVAAAIAAVFALKLEQTGIPQAQLLVPLTFSIIIGTVVFQSMSARPLAQFLRVAEPEPNGLLIIGANRLAREIAKAVQLAEIPVLLADDSWDNIRKARMEGLETYYGNPVSEHADRHLDLVGLGHMIGLSPDNQRNHLAAVRYRSEFGANAVYVLKSRREKNSSKKHRIAKLIRARTLSSTDVSFSKLSSLLSQGAEIRRTTVTDSFSFSALTKQSDRHFIPILAIDPKRRLRIFCEESSVDPDAGWTIVGVSFLPHQEKDSSQQQESKNVINH